MSDLTISEHDLGLPKTDTRTAAVPALKEFVKSQEAIIGTTPVKRVGWLVGMSPTDFSSFLVQLNATARGFAGTHTFDGKNVRAGKVSGSIPPDQQDKEQLLQYALSEVKRISQQMLTDDSTHQEVLDRAAVVLPVVVNKLHLFGDGNGRTSRVLRMLIKDGSVQTDTNIDAIVNKDVINYDASPRPLVEQVITQAIVKLHGTNNIALEDDLDSDFVETLADPAISLGEAFRNIDPYFANIRLDYLNFNVLARDYAKKHNLGESGVDGRIRATHSIILTEASTNTDKKTEFLELYRGIRKERVIVLIDALTGKNDIPMPPERILDKVNSVRKLTLRPLVVADDVNTVRKALTASMEAKSPLRVV